MDAVSSDRSGEQLELTLGPLYEVVVTDRVSGSLSDRPDRAYRSPPQPIEHARRLAALLLDRGADVDGEGPWRRPLPGGQRYVEIHRAPPAGLA